MKNNIIKLIVPVLFFVMLSSCGEDPYVEYADGGTQKITDAFLQISTPVVSFQAGIPKYDIALNIVNGVKQVTKVNIYSTFTDAKTGAVSEEALFKSVDVPAGAKTPLNQSFTYADLKKGLTVNGQGLPASDVDLAVGSGWKFRFEGESAAGIVPLGGNITVAVLSRFAGIYKIVEFAYFRIGVPTALADYYIGATRFIGSVDAKTFSYNDYWGGFAWTGQSFRFTVDEATGKINVPILVNGAIFSGDRALNCANDASIMTKVSCDGSNILIKNEATGKHRIKLTYGYLAASGPREFYEVLEKVVE